MNTAELKEFVALEKEKTSNKGRLNEIENRLVELKESISKQFLEDGMQSTNIDGRTVYLHRDIYASAKCDEGDAEGGEVDTATKRAPVIAALKACDLGQYVREDYNARSLTAYVREMVLAAEELARAEGRVLDDPAKAVPEQLAATLKISTVFSVSSRRS